MVFVAMRREAMGRKSEPDTTIVTLNDYRRRHAQYKSDPDAQVMHASMPMIAIWDDHEPPMILTWMALRIMTQAHREHGRPAYLLLLGHIMSGCRFERVLRRKKIIVASILVILSHSI